MNLDLRARAATAILELAFNPHQRRGPDGRWIKMGTDERKDRRRDRDRARRAEQKAAKEQAAAAEAPPVPAAAPPARDPYRQARDSYNLQIADAAVHQQNEFDGAPDPMLNLRLKRLREAIGGDPQEADDWADRVRESLSEYQAEDDLPRVPSKEDFDADRLREQEETNRRLREALDGYNNEMRTLGQAWVDMLRDPETREDPEGGLDHLSDDDVAMIEANVNGLKRGLLRDEPERADAHAAELRRLLTGHRLQTERDLPEKSVAEDFRPPPKPLIQRKSSDLLSSNAPHAQRLAALSEASSQGIWGDEPIGQGAMGETSRVMFNDGTTAIHKKAKGDWPTGGDAWTPRDQTDAEELASLVGGALGLRAPAVQRISEDEINVELVEDAQQGYQRFYSADSIDQLRVSDKVMSSDDALLMGLFDVLVDNPDRHGYNWMIDDQDRIYPIDHGLAFINLKGTPQNLSAAARSPFAREYFVDRSTGLYRRENQLSRRDVRYVRQRLAALEPEFGRLGREGWYRVMQMRLDGLEKRAKGGSVHQLPAPGKD